MVKWRPPFSLSILGALCAFLSVVEYLIPKPFPFLRIGLANMPLLLALVLDLKSFALLAVIKVIAGALLSGTLFSYAFLFSAAGTLASAVTARLLWRLSGLRRPPKRPHKRPHTGGDFDNAPLSFAGIGVCGALASNLSQIALARFCILGKGAWYIAPPFLAAGIITGFTLGLFCNRFSRRSRWYREIHAYSAVPFTPEDSVSGGGAPAALAACGALFACVYAAIHDIKIKCILFAVISLFFVISKKKNNYIFSLLFFIGIIFFNILTPFGKVLFALGPFRMTGGALTNGISKALTAQGLVFISRLCVSSETRLPGAAGGILSGVFACLEHINRYKGRLDRHNLIESLDAVLIDVSKERLYKS